MASWSRAIGYGFLVWAITFAVSLGVSPLRTSWRTLFESIMPVVLAAVVVAFALLYFRRVAVAFVREGVWLGLLWLLINWIVDLPLMLSPPMNMTLAEYAADVGLTYVMIPVITVGLGAARSASGS